MVMVLVLLVTWVRLGAIMLTTMLFPSTLVRLSPIRLAFAWGVLPISATC